MENQLDNLLQAVAKVAEKFIARDLDYYDSVYEVGKLLRESPEDSLEIKTLKTEFSNLFYAVGNAFQKTGIDLSKNCETCRGLTNDAQ